MEYKKFVTGMLEVNTYIIPDGSGDCLIIDPSDGCETVIGCLQKEKLRPVAILLTHGHFDHIMGIPEILGVYGGTKVYIHDNDRQMLGDPIANRSARRGMDFLYEKNIEPLTEGRMSVEGFDFGVLHTPGHTRGGCDFLFDSVCFCGDTIFANSVGRSDFPGGNHNQLIESIKSKIMTLPPETVLCPGHGGRTSVEREKRANPYLQGLY